MRTTPRHCPLCRTAIGDGMTNCPRCGARVAALERRRRRDSPAGATARPAAPPTAGAVSTRGLPLRVARRGLLGGAALVGLAAVAAAVVAVLRGGFLDALGNIAGIVGGVVLALAALMGGVRPVRWGADVEALRRHARGQGAHASVATRVAVALAGAVPLLLAIALAATAR